MKVNYTGTPCLLAASRGFSLPECLITLAIIGIVVSVSTLGILKYTQRRELVIETDYIRLLLEHAAIVALTTGEEVSVTFSERDIVMEHPQSRFSLKHPLPPHVRVKKLGSGSAAATQISFYPTIAASPATLSVTSPAGACSLTIALRTRITTLC